MRNATKSTRTNDLIRLLGVLRVQQQQLLECVESKLEAIRQADVSAMQKLQKKERTLVDRMREREGLRRQLMDAIGRDLGWPVGAGRALHISQLAARLNDPERVQLVDAAHALRDLVFRVQRTNRIAGAVSRDVLGHLHWVLASVAPRCEKSVGYSGEGAVVTVTGTQVFEAVG